MSSTLPPDQLYQLEAICDRFESELRIGKIAPCDLSKFLEQVPGNIRKSAAKELLQIEWDYRSGLGEVPVLADYLQANILPEPQLAQLLAHWKRNLTLESTFDRFELVERLGEGRFGIVWKAFDNQLNRWVAIKFAHPGIVNDADRFLSEAKSAGRLNHANIVRILDAGERDGRLYIVREYVDGCPLNELIKNQQFTSRETAIMINAVCQALIHSHQLKCIHRDIKPQNIIVTGDGIPRLTDFGLAKLRDADGNQTISGTVLGTPAYMSPEQARGESNTADERTDIYSVGIVLYEMLVGTSPFRGNIEQIINQVLNSNPRHVRALAPGVPADLATICMKCLEKEPAARYQSATELSEDLQRFLADIPIRANPLNSLQRTTRWARRNPLLAGLFSAVLLLLIAVAATAIAFSVSIKHSLDREIALRKSAEDERAKASVAAVTAQNEARFSGEVTRFLEELFASSDPSSLAYYGTPTIGNPDMPAKDMLERAAQRLRDEKITRPRVRARLLDTVANIQRSVGDFEGARSLFDEAKETRQQLGELRPESLTMDWLLHHMAYGLLEQTLGNYDEADGHYQQAEELVYSQTPLDQLRLADLDFQRGWMLLEQKINEKAKFHFEQCLSKRVAELPADHPLIWVSRVAIAQCDLNHADNWELLASQASTVFPVDEIARTMPSVWKLQAYRKQELRGRNQRIRLHIFSRHPTNRARQSISRSDAWRLCRHALRSRGLPKGIRHY
ncbi:MAG: serine/threonine-protein kinase [Pirellulaceae bacterium]